MTKLDALQVAGIRAAHHRELVELAVEQDYDMADTLLDAGNSLDEAIKLAHSEGASLYEMWSATKLPVIYLVAATTLEGGHDPDDEGDRH